MGYSLRSLKESDMTKQLTLLLSRLMTAHVNFSINILNEYLHSTQLFLVENATMAFYWAL